jgi:hypothetical protein
MAKISLKSQFMSRETVMSEIIERTIATVLKILNKKSKPCPKPNKTALKKTSIKLSIS